MVMKNLFVITVVAIVEVVEDLWITLVVASSTFVVLV
jgi:hypothetical protein